MRMGACNVEQDSASSKVKPPQEPVVLVCGEPASLPYVFAESFSPNLLIRARSNISVVSVVRGGKHLDFMMLTHSVVVVCIRGAACSGNAVSIIGTDDVADADDAFV